MPSEPEGFRITTIHAFTMIGEDGDEGVVAAKVGDTFFPLVSADERRLESYRGMAEQIAREAGSSIVLKRFTLTSSETLPLKTEWVN